MLLFWAIVLLTTGGVVGYQILHTYIIPEKVQCPECLYTIRAHPNRPKTTCKYCDTQYIYRADGKLVKRNRTGTIKSEKTFKLKKKSKTKSL